MLQYASTKIKVSVLLGSYAFSAEMPHMRLSKSARDGAASAAAFGAAIGAGAFAASLENSPPIVPALVSSLVLAGIEWKLGIPSPHAESNFDNLASWVASLLVAVLLLAVLAYVMPVGSQFICEPLVPWGISIGIFGAFFSAWIVAGMSVRPSDLRRQPIVRLILFWVAPFYGFFHAPWFLAQQLMLPCPGRPVAQVVIVAATMILAVVAGARVGEWMFGRPD